MSATEQHKEIITVTEYIHNVRLNTVTELVDLALYQDYVVETYEGVLNDLHIIHDCGDIRLGNRRGYNYIVCYYTFASPYHNNLHILLTDDFDLVLSYIPND